jgi:hypothetical protein
MSSKRSLSILCLSVFLTLLIVSFFTGAQAATVRFLPETPEVGERITVRVTTSDLGPCDLSPLPPELALTGGAGSAALENGEVVVRIFGYCNLGLVGLFIQLQLPLTPLPAGTYPVRYIRTSNGGASVPETFGPIYFLTVKAASGIPPEPVPLSNGALVVLMLAVGIATKRRLCVSP